MQTTAIGTVANSLPENEAILLTILISDGYIPYTDLWNIFVNSGSETASLSFTLEYHVA